MNFKKEHGIIIGFITTLVVPLVMGIFIHNNNTDEKRTPAEFPTTFSDDYFDRFNKWYTDHAPFRTGMIDIYNGLTQNLEKAFRNWLIEQDIKNNPNKNHVHLYTDWVVEKEATEEETGLQIRTCEICGKVDEQEIPKAPHVHRFSDEWDYSEYEHWHNAICEHKDLYSDLGQHNFGETMYDKDGNPYHVCDVCGCIGYISEGGEHAHIFSRGWTYDENIHWHNAICEHKDLRKDEAPHNYGEWHAFDNEKGIRAKTCDTCKYNFLEDISSRMETGIYPDDQPYYAYASAGEDVLFGREDWLYLLWDNSLEYYKGTNLMSDDYLATQIRRMKIVQNICDQKGITLVYAMFPNKEQVYSEYMPTIEDRKDILKRAQVFNNYVQLNTDFNFTYPLDILRKGKINYPTYYKQDTHWNEYGGALAAEEMFNRLGWEFKGVDVYTIDKTGGDLIALSGAPSVSYIEPKVIYKSDVDLTWTYSSTYIDKIVSSNKNGKKLLLAGDSFRYSICKFFASEVEETWSIHRDQFIDGGVKDFVRSLGKGDIIVYPFVERLDYDAFDKLDDLAALLLA